MGMTTPAQPALQRSARAAHGVLGDVGAGSAFDLLRPVVGDSWRRSLGFLAPGRIEPPVALASGDLAAYLRDHPLSAVLPVITRLLVEPARDTGLLVAVGDADGRLLWVEGDDDAVRRAEAMAFVPGADWSERAVGTSAPGTALATGRGVQVSGAEHFSEIAHRFSCTAAPIHGPDGRLLGVVDITGGPEAVAVHSLSLVSAAVAAAEAELRFAAFRGDVPRPAPASRSRTTPAKAPTLSALGRDDVELACGTGTLTLTGRHAEIATLLAWHQSSKHHSRHPGGGLSAEALAVALLGEDARTVTLRAEIARLRHVLRDAGFGLELASRPYRLEPAPGCDARSVLDLVGQGRYRQALALYHGLLLPRSDAPGIRAIRGEVSGALREAMLADAGPEVLTDYLELPEAAEDVDALVTALRILPPRSPRRAVVLSRLDRLDAQHRR
ncbi:GAF domain-containing protein [Zhihengliuella halotolerans]|uniref:GAF domain-containing protein n=2 Tax=Zhihengliuella halotolerans TaxID=370736 RepID=A0A4Q8AFH3_9MICC|nr:GAF domain-containing protein [Zhihengliuella halotolerans]